MDYNNLSINEYQKKLYHKYKNDSSKSHYLPNRLKKQRDKYKDSKNYEIKKYYTKNTGKIENIKINYNNYIIKFN